VKCGVVSLPGGVTAWGHMGSHWGHMGSHWGRWGHEGSHWGHEGSHGVMWGRWGWTPCSFTPAAALESSSRSGCVGPSPSGPPLNPAAVPWV